MRKILLGVLIFMFSLSSQASIDKILGPIPVQDSGRVKPLDTFARETLQLIYGKKEYNGKSAVEIIFTWVILPQHWNTTDFVQVDNKILKEKLGLDISQKRFSPDTLIYKDELQVLLKDLQEKREKKEKLNSYYQAVDRLQSQLTLYKAITQGMVPGFVPPQEGTSWTALKDFTPEFSEQFIAITKAFAGSLRNSAEEPVLEKAVQVFIERARSENLNLVPSPRMIALEVQYNRVHPFQWAWILYISSCVLFMLYFILQKERLFLFSWYFFLAAFVLHTYGFILRVVLSGRPPVSNMYETVIWVPWGAVLFSIIFLKVLKNRFFVLASAMISFICLVLADMAPVILDSSLQPLVPVLRSNLWLTVHVLTITISYGALFLAFMLSDIALVFYFINEVKYEKHLAALREAVYRADQVGVVLLGAGTILGGVWADYSWGRFWGWDPKETWALIAFLGYIAILHGRLAGWIKPFGFIFWNIIAFNLVVMAWYGVNYVLGAGLHSYGFGGGGLPVVAAFSGAHLIFATAVWYIRTQRRAT